MNHWPCRLISMRGHFFSLTLQLLWGIIGFWAEQCQLALRQFSKKCCRQISYNFFTQSYCVFFSWFKSKLHIHLTMIEGFMLLNTCGNQWLHLKELSIWYTCICILTFVIAVADHGIWLSWTRLSVCEQRCVVTFPCICEHTQTQVVEHTFLFLKRNAVFFIWKSFKVNIEYCQINLIKFN